MSSGSLSFPTLSSARTLPRENEKSQLLNARCPTRVTKFLGTRLRSSGRSLGSERLHIWLREGPGQSPKLRVVVRSALSAVPDMPQGLYGPTMDKDCSGIRGGIVQRK